MKLSRRDFLRGLGAVAIAAAVSSCTEQETYVEIEGDLDGDGFDLEIDDGSERIEFPPIPIPTPEAQESMAEPTVVDTPNGDWFSLITSWDHDGWHVYHDGEWIS